MILEGKKCNVENVEVGYLMFLEEVIIECVELIGFGVFKYFIFDFNLMMIVYFDLDKVIDFLGCMGVLVMYVYVRIHGLKRELGAWPELDEQGVAQAFEVFGLL